MEVEVIRHEKFDVIYNPPADCRMIILIGGRGGMKTYEASKAIAYHATCTGRRVQVLRDEAAKIKQSILNEVLQRYDSANEEGAFDGLFIRGENAIKDAQTGHEVVFTQGFRASTTAKTAHMKGVAGVDIGVVEELADIRDEDKFNSWKDSIRGEGAFIIVILNTPDIHHWLIKRYFNLIPVDHTKHEGFTPEDVDGYFEIQPKNLPGIYTVQTSYLDNKYLPQRIIEEYAAYGVKGGSYENIHYFLTEICGYANSGIKGQYFKKYKYISLADYLALPYTEAYGQDFGRSSPAGTIGMKVHKERLYVRELNYEGMELKPLAFKLNDLGFTGNTLIVADCAEPDTIRNLRFGIKDLMSDKEKLQYPVAASGFNNIRPAPDKGIEAGLNKLLSMEIYVVESSTNLITEFQMYCEARDRDGKPMGKPIDAYNHLIDPMRYVIQVHGRWW